MAEEVKKAPKPVDPNSAKYKLGKIAADAYVDAIEAKKRGEKVAWVSSNFPVEIPETMGIATVYPENQAAGIAARGAGTRMCEVAESEGYSNDICAYARVSLAYAKLKSCPEQDVAIAALTGPREQVEEQRMKYQERRDALCDGLEGLGWERPNAHGSMFVWAKLPGGRTDSMAFCEELMEKAGVVVTPGASFGPSGEGHVRMALVLPPDQIALAVEAIREAGLY